MNEPYFKEVTLPIWWAACFVAYTLFPYTSEDVWGGLIIFFCRLLISLALLKIAVTLFGLEAWRHD